MTGSDSPRRFCIYCFTKENLSRAHLFPRSIGGKIQLKVCCTRCNSLIGQKLEAPVEDCLFFVGGVVTLGIKPRDDAFRKITIRDADTNDRLKYVDGQLHKEASVTSTGNLTGSIEDIIRRSKKRFRSQHPDLLEQYKKQVRKGEGTFRVGEEIYEIKLDSKKTSVEYTGKVQFPYDLLAKISFEAMWLFQQFTGEIIQDFYRSTFVVDKTDSIVTDIDVGSSFKSRVICRSHSVLLGKSEFHEISYKPHHRLDFRISKNDVAYIRIEFFGVLPFIVSLGVVDKNSCTNIDAWDKSFFFPISESTIFDENYPVKYQWVRDDEDDLADAAWRIYLNKVDES